MTGLGPVWPFLRIRGGEGEYVSQLRAPKPTSAAIRLPNGGNQPFSTKGTVEVTRRVHDLSIKRKPLVHPTPFVEYWAKHAPDALDLADEFEISDRQVRDLWKRAILTKGAPLEQQQGEWEDYQESLHGNARRSSAAGRRG